MSEPIDLQAFQIRRLALRDAEALQAAGMVGGPAGHRAQVLMRLLEAVEQHAWCAYDARFALGLIVEEAPSGSVTLQRALLYRETDEPLPTDTLSVLEEMEHSQRVPCPGATISVSWGASA